MKTWAEHKANLLRSVSLLPLGVSVPKEGIKPLNGEFWRSVPDLVSFNTKTGEYGMAVMLQ